MMEYAANLQKFTDALEKQKQQQLEDLRRRLLEKRRQNKKDLHKTQVGAFDIANEPFLNVISNTAIVSINCY